VPDVARFRLAVAAWAAGGPGAPDAADAARAEAGRGLRTVVLVEGVSDRSAVEALAEQRGVDLPGRGACVVAMGGAMSAGRYLQVLGRPGLGLALRGLYDEAEEGHIRRGLERAGHGTGLDRPALAELGFHVCVTDLEDELIRALRPAGVERVLAAHGDLARFRVFQNQPAQRGRPVERQLHRFLGTTSGRKERYARLLVRALDPDRTPCPLARVLALL
jgi:hypothetical protein